VWRRSAQEGGNLLMIEGFQVRHDTDDRLITPDPLSLFVQDLSQAELKIPRPPGRPGFPLVCAFFSDHVAQEQIEVALLHFLRGRAGRYLKPRILFGAPSQTIRHLLSNPNQGGLIISYGDLGHIVPASSAIFLPLWNKILYERGLSSAHTGSRPFLSCGVSAWAGRTWRTSRGTVVGHGSREIVDRVLYPELCQQRLRLLQVRGIKPLGEPAVDRGQQLVGFCTLVLALP
jgi:hypothetical protein